jgi:hypothetical protein
MKPTSPARIGCVHLVSAYTRQDRLQSHDSTKRYQDYPGKFPAIGAAAIATVPAGRLFGIRTTQELSGGMLVRSVAGVFAIAES